MPSVLEKFFFDPIERERVHHIAQALLTRGATIYVTGGAVRDFLLHRQSSDIDLEVHGITLHVLQEVLSSYGHVNLVGKSFGILRFEHSHIDWAIPRRDSFGRKPEVQLLPTLDIVEALRRRDLTINAMAIDLFTGELIDPFGGKNDVEKRIARSPDVQFFAEDPLRFYRVMQFISRFNLTPDAELNSICATMNLHDIASERIFAEFDKLFLESQAPSLGIRWLHRIGRLSEILPEIAATVGVEQPVQWHPEGDVFEHLMQALDAAAQEKYANDQERLTLLSAAFCHDVGKVVATKCIDGRIRSINHDVMGVPIAASLMARITGIKKRIDSVRLLVRYHMAPLQFSKNNAGDAAYKRLAYKLAPSANLLMLTQLASADSRGRNGHGHVPLTEHSAVVGQFYERARELGVLTMPERPLLSGEDFLDVLTPGIELGKAVRRAYELQIQEHEPDKQRLKKRVLLEFGSGFKSQN